MTATANNIFQITEKSKDGCSKQRAVGKKLDIHQKVTDSIIQAMKEGLKSGFQMPWNKVSLGIPRNEKSGNNYKGINILSLWVDADEKGFTCSKWATYKQWAELGYQVRKGESGSSIVFFSPYEKENKETGETEARAALKFSTVFNGCQVEGFDTGILENQKNLVCGVEHLDAFINNTGADISIQGGRACYIPSQDKILMPEKKLFKGTDNQSPTEAFYSVLLHELTHWTKPAHRADRKGYTENPSGAYAFEELVAELGSAFLCAELNVASGGRDDHAAYIQGWLTELENDPKFIFKAAAQASAAVEFLNSTQSKEA